MSKIVMRTLEFFELFAEQKRPLVLSEISKLLDIPVSSCHDVLKTLLEVGYIYELEPRAGFYPTLKFWQLASRIVEHDPVILRAEFLIRELRDEFDESASLAKIGGASATYLVVFEPSQALRFAVRVGDKIRALHATSAGKAVLGSLTATEREKAYRGIRFDQLTEKTITSLERLRRDIDEGIERGWFINREESIPGVITVSSSCTWDRTKYIITMAGPTFRMEPKLDQVVVRLLEKCRALEFPERSRGSGPASSTDGKR